VARIYLKDNQKLFYSRKAFFIILYNRFCREQLERYAKGIRQRNLGTECIEKLKLPLLNYNFQIQLDEFISLSFLKLNESKTLYTQAETLLLEAIGLKDFEPSKEPINIKSFKESFLSTGRLDAEYYQKKYERYESLILNQKHTYIRDEYTHIKTLSSKDKLGYNYIEIGDISVGDGSYKSNYVFTNELPANAKNLVEKGDILISNVRPYRGAVTIINTDEEDLIVSGAFTVLRKSNKSIFNNEVLKVLLRSGMYKDWLLKFNVGTSYPVIKDADILNLPIPFVAETTQETIASILQESALLKAESERLLEVAKKAVEIAIEEGEETALKFIKDNS
ncbi:MAG: restriction endonuclease subunit S, partial [Bacteroidetes bacterium]|nr:restriction endonuclease subunit S [Bacteroidota bacterium]